MVGLTTCVDRDIINYKAYYTSVSDKNMSKQSHRSLFISYQRADKALALSVFQHFAPDFDVFMDERPYDASTRLSPFVIRQIKARPYFVMLITPSTLYGHRFNTLFWREAEVALRHKRLIIPFVTHISLWNTHRRYLINQLARLIRLDGISLPFGKWEEVLMDFKARLHHVTIPSEVVMYKIPVTDKTQAQAYIERLLQYPTLQPEQLRPVAYYERAYAHRFDKQHDEALAHYNEAVYHHPSYADAYLARAELHPDDEMRLSDLKAAVQHDPQFADAYLALGDHHRAHGDQHAAIDAYTRAIAINPHCAVYYTRRGNCYLAVGDAERAADDFDQAVILEAGEVEEATTEPRYDTMRFTASDFYKRAVESHQKGNLLFALHDLTESLQAYPDNSEVLYERGNVYVDLGDYAKALADYDAALALNAYDDKIYVARAKTHIHMGNFAQALADLDHAIQLNPANSEAYHQRGCLYYQRQMYAEALADFNAVLARQPDHAASYNNRGMVHRALGHLDQAIADYTEAIRLNPNYAYAYNNRGYAYYMMGDYDRALSDIDRALDLMPSYTMAWQNRMLVWKRMRGMS